MLIPGMGVVFDGALDPKPLPDTRPRSAHQLIVNCPWPAAKINAHEVAVVAAIIRQFRAADVALAQQTGVYRTLRLQFFPNIYGKKLLDIAALKRQLEQELGTFRAGVPGFVEVDVFPTLAREKFIAQSSIAHLALDAFPFGGCLTVLVRSFC